MATTKGKTLSGLIAIFLITSFISHKVTAQNEVAIGSTTTKSNAILWLNGNGSQGLILPVVTSKSAVSNPDKGMIVYDNTDNKVWYRNDNAWVEVGAGGGSSANLNLQLQGNTLQLRDGTTVLNSSNLSSGTPTDGTFLIFSGGAWQAASLSGDVAGSNGSLVVNGIKGKTLPALPSSSQVLVYDGTAWKFQALTGGTDSQSLTFTAPNLSISNGNSVDLSTLDKDQQTLTLTGNNLGISGGNSVTLPSSTGVTSITTGTGLTGGTITTTGTINVDVGTTASKIVQLDGTGKLPAVDGSQLTNLPAPVETGDISDVVAGTGLTGGATTGSATLNVDVGTTANKIVQLDGAGKLPAVDGSQLTNLAGGGDITGVSVGTGLTGGGLSGNVTLSVDAGTTANKIVQLDGTGKLPAIDGSQLTNLAGDISGVVAGTGLTGGATTGSATLNVDVGTTANKIVQLDGTGKLPSVDGSQLTNLPSLVETGDISDVVAGTGLTGGATTGSATLNVDIGTTANKIVQLDGTGKLPAVDGSQLTNLAGDISGVVAGTGLTGGATTGSATLNVDVGTTANKIVQLDGTGKLPAIDGSQLTNLAGGGDITGVSVGNGLTGGGLSGNVALAVDAGTTANKIVQLDGTGKLPAVDGSQLTNLPAPIETGDISDVVAGTGLIGGATTGSATLNVDVGTTANKIIQLDGTGKLPAVDGSQLTNLPTIVETGDISDVIAGTGLTGGATTGPATLNVNVGTGANQIPQLDGTGKLVSSTIPASVVLNGTVPNAAGDIAGDYTSGLTIKPGSITGAELAGNIAINTTGPLSAGATTVSGLTIGTATWPANASGALTNDGTGSLTWVPTGGTGTVTSVGTGTGLTGGPITTSGTIAVDVGTTAGKIVQLDGTGKLPAVDGSLLTNLPAGIETGDISDVVAGTGLTGGATTGSATLNVDVGTTAGKIVQLDGTGKLPAVDGSLLTNLPAPIETGDISDVVAGTGLTGGATTGSATLNVDVGTTANKIVQLDGTGKLPAIDGSQLTNLTGDISDVVAGTGLTGGATTGSATLNVDVGTTANKIVQLDGTGKLPAIDGSQLTNLPAGATTLDGLTDATIVTPASGQILVNDGAGQFKNVALSGDATLSNAGALTIANGAISGGTAGKILDATITDADINAAAGILGTKVSPDFGAQNISTTGSLFAGAGVSALSFGQTDGVALRGTSQNNSTSSTGVFGVINTAGNTSPLNIGVRGYVDQTSVTSTNYGLMGSAINSGVTNYGVYGAAANATTNWAGYFEGNAAITGGLAVGSTPGFGTVGQVLTSQGAGVAPIWSAGGGSGFSTLNKIPKGDGTALVASQLFDNGTSVGVGTTSPIAEVKIDIRGSGTDDGGGINISNSDASHQMLIFPGRLNDPNPYIGVKTGDPLRFATFLSESSGFNELMRISSSGNVGIGTTTPKTKLQIGQISHLTDLSGSTLLSNNIYNNGGTLQHTTAAGGSVLGLESGKAGIYINSSAAADATFGSSLANRLVISETGVSINKDGSDPSAVLHVVSQTTGGGGTPRGFMMPSLITADRNAISSPLDGLMIYNQDNHEFNYYNSLAASWQTVGGGSGWSLTGNAGTLATNSFIGTTDADPLIFRFNSQSAGRIDAGSTFFGSLSGNVNSGLDNTGIGRWALTANQNGVYNTALGSQAMFTNTAGSNNVAVGSLSLYSTTGGENTGIGVSALGNSTGNSNTAVGMQSLISNLTGSKNTTLGAYADVIAGGLTNATAIGYNAKVGASNSLVLGGTGGDAVKVGIGTTTPAAGFDISNATGGGYLGGYGTAARIGTTSEAFWNLVFTNGSATNGDYAMLVENNGNLSFFNDPAGATYYQRFTLASNGNVGIGNPTPTAKLDIAGNIKIADGTQGLGKVLTSDATGLASWQAAGGGGFTTLNTIPKGDGSAMVASQLFDDGTNVGIGTIAPSAKLEVSHNTVNGGMILNRSDVTIAKSEIKFNQNGSQRWAIGNDLGEIGEQSFFIYDIANDASRMFINSSGFVGFGTGSPGFKIDARGNTGDADDAALLQVANGDESHRMILFPGRSGDPLPFIQVSGTDPIRFANNAGAGFNELMQISGSGNVGIGSTAPPSKLAVIGDGGLSPSIPGTASTGVIRAGVSSNEGLDIGKMIGFPYASWLQSGFDGSAADPLSLQPVGGTVGIGTTSPGQLLTIAGAGAAFGIDNTAYFQAKNNGGTYENYFWPRWSDNVMYMNYGLGGFNIRNNSSTSIMFMTDGGNVGIGTTTPDTGVKLDVRGGFINTGGYTGLNVTADASSGNVGIGDYPYSNVKLSVKSNQDFAIYAERVGGGTAGYFLGNVGVSGSLSKGSGTFKIDHPLDPENKFLYHSFVESPDMMNVYNGNITTNAEGEATVDLPDYFNSLNKDFRYQLTVIGTFAQAIVYEEVSSNNSFKVKTDKPNVKVSWQVTGIRKDPYAEKNRVVPEVSKSADERGKYLHPEAYGLSTERGIRPKEDKKIKPLDTSKDGGVNQNSGASDLKIDRGMRYKPESKQD